MHHFFLPPTAIHDGVAEFSNDIARQIQRVLRLNLGDTVVVLDNTGAAYEAILHYDGQRVMGTIQSSFELDTEPSVNILLLACVSQREKYEWILQKGTELGVTAFLPVISERSLVQQKQAIDKKKERWESILQEAAEQSHRARLPILHSVLTFTELLESNILNQPDSCHLMAHTDSMLMSLKTALERNQCRNFAVLIGPEGGFTPEESEQAIQAGFQPVALGKRILRMETAAIAAVSAIVFHSSSS